MLEALTTLIPEGIPVAVGLAALAGAVLITGIAKSGFGGGVGILAVPLVAVALDAQLAVGVMLPILLAADLVAVAQHRRDRSAPHLRWALIGGVLGIAVGTTLLGYFTIQEAAPPIATAADPGSINSAAALAPATASAAAGQSLATALNLTVGGVCLLLVGLQLYRMFGGRVPRIPRHRAAGITAGGLAGFVSTLAHAAGPVMTVYILDQGLDKRRIVGTLVLYFFVINWFKVPTFLALGFITPHTLSVSGLLILLVPLGSLLGLWLNRVIPEKPFTLVMYAGAGLAGVWLVVKGLR
ncbi:MAG: sulfite exporter TauE/SafE family protein [Planctomycetota bacterium]